MAASLRVSQTPIKDCWVVETSLFEDMRGTFVETWNSETFSEVGLPVVWPQDNISVSHKNVFRGLHIQRRKPQGKLVRCIEGAIVDICLDLRPDSPSFKQIHYERLSGGKSLYLPPGTAHGFLALEARNVVYYKCSSLYDRESDGGVNALGCGLDSLLKSFTDLIVSDKDRNLPSLEQWLADPRGIYVER